MPRRRSNPLALAVLACLSERPMHPYEMAATMRTRGQDQSIRLNYGSLYGVVENLLKRGLLEEQEVVREGRRPERTVYRITDEGRAEFSRWIDEFAQRGPQDDQVRSPLLLSVFFGHFVDRDTLRHLLEEYRGRHRRVLAQVESMLDALGDDHSLPGAALARRVAYEHLMVEWLGDTLERVSPS